MKKNSSIVALMDEYRRATIAYKQILADLSPSFFTQIFDKNTEDEDCRSIQTITTHVIRSGHNYANYINLRSGIEWFYFKEIVDSPQKGIEGINKMLDFTEDAFGPIWYKPNEELESWTFETTWKVTYDFEQLMEHAIVHVLRHRRQVENMIRDSVIS